MMSINYFVYGCESENEVQDLFGQSAFVSELVFVSLDQFLHHKRATAEDRVIVYGEVQDIKQVFAQSFIFGFSVAIVAKKEQKYLQDTFEIPKNPLKALETALKGECKAIDLLYCQDEIVLWSALVGEAPPHGAMSQRQLHGSRPSRFLALLKAFSKIFKLKKSVIQIQTYKKQEIHTTASGIVIVEHDNHTCASALLKEFLSLSNGKMVALLVSPSSVTEYFGYLYKAIFGRTKTMPKATGVVLSERLKIDATPPLEVQVDGQKCCQTPVVFDLHPKALSFCGSEKFWKKEASRQSDDKEVVKLGALPASKNEVEYSQKHIPFFPHADTEKYQELFASLREEARAESTFITLMILSTLLATVGLFLNSASVIIGAMLLAPLMQPIVSFSMGLLRFDMDLFWNGLRSVIIGIMLVLGTSLLLAYLLPFKTVTPEIAGRLHPTLLDLIVAIVSGIAAAYAKNNTKIIGSLAGVSIAVALVPPIATAGIGIGWQNWSIFQSAFLLFLTNFAGILFAAALTFMVLGFSPVKRAKKGLLISTLTVLLISIPLYFSFNLMVKDARIKDILQNGSYQIAKRDAYIENLLIIHRKNPNRVILRFDLVSDYHFKDIQKHLLKKEIALKIQPYLRDDEKVILEISERLRY